MNSGDRDTWVLLRGLTREARHWGDFPRRLSAHLGGATVLTPDLPGNGRLHHADSPASVAGLLAALRAQLAAGPHRPPYRVLAMSLGAMVTIEWATRHPDEVASALLINTSLRPYSPFWQRLRPRNYGPLLACLLTAASPRRWEATILRATTRLQRNPEALVDRWVRLRDDAPVSARNALRQLWAAARYRGPMVKPAVPLGLLSSAGDRLVDPRCSTALAAAWGCPHATHPDAGHDLPQDDPEWVLAQLAAFRARMCPGTDAG